MCSLRLRAKCTFENQDSNNTSRCIEWDNESIWTHRNSNGGGLFPHDYILVPRKVLGFAGVVRGGFDFGSDHWPIDAFLRLEEKKSWRTICQHEFSQRGWQPRNDSAKWKFAKGLLAIHAVGIRLRKASPFLLWRSSSTRMQLGSILIMTPFASGVLFKDTSQDLLSHASI